MAVMEESKVKKMRLKRRRRAMEVEGLEAIGDDIWFFG